MGGSVTKPADELAESTPRADPAHERGFVDTVLGGAIQGLTRRGVIAQSPHHDDHEFQNREAFYFSQAFNLGEHLAVFTEQWIRDQEQAEATLRVWEVALETLHAGNAE